MFLNDELKNNKDIKYYEESNYPLLKIIYRKKNSKNNEKNHFSSLLNKSNKNKSSSNLILKKITPNNKNKKSKYNSLENNSSIFFSNDSNNIVKKPKNKLIDFSSDNSNKSGNIHKKEKNPFHIRNKVSRAYTNKFLFPKLNKTNLIRLKKEINDKNYILDPNLKSNLKMNNNNITFSSEPNSEKYLFLQKLNENKYQKSLGLENFINDTDNNTYNTRFITNTDGNQISEYQINTENIDLKDINKSKFNYNNNIFFNYSKIKDDMSTKNPILNKKINISEYSNSFNIDGYNKRLAKKRFSIATPKSNIFLSIPRNDISNKKYSFKNLNFNAETINASPIIKKRIEEMKNDKFIIKGKSGEINENNNNKFRFPYRRDRGKRMTTSYNNNFTFFNKLLDRKYEMINNINRDNINNDDINNNRTRTKRNTIMNISKSFNYDSINNKMSLFSNNKNNINIFKKESKTSLLVKDIISSRNESFASSGSESESESELSNTINLENKNQVNEENKEPTDNEEMKYLDKKRLKLMNQTEEVNKSSYLYNSYNEELKNYFLKNCVVDRITDNIFENFEPIESKLEAKEDMEIKKDKYLKDAFEQIFKKVHKYCHCFEKMFKFVKSMLKQDNITTELNIRNNNHILEMFQVYKKLLKLIDYKWNNKKKRENHYKKMNELFTSESKSIPNEKGKRNKKFWSYDKELRILKEIIIFKERINRENDLSFNDLIHIKPSSKIRKYTESKSKSNVYTESKLNRFKIRKRTKNSESKSISGYQNNIIALLGQRSRESTLKIINERRASEDGESINKLTNKLKFKNEFINNSRTESFVKFAKIYRLSSHSRLRSHRIEKNFNPNENKVKNLKKGAIQSKTLNNLDNYNILRSSKFFKINKNQIKLQKRFSKLIRLKKDRIQIDKKLRHDSIAIKIAGIDQLTKEAALIKTHEIAKDLPDAKLFDKIVKMIQKRKISKFEYIINNEEEKFNNIINKQELSTGNTLLIYATQINQKAIVEMLLSKGADPNIKNHFGNTALHMAYKNDNAFIINLLIEYGANEKLKNNKYLFPWQMSKYIN